MATSGKSATHEIAEFVASTRWQDLPVAVVDMTRDLILDSIGCALAGILVDKGSIPVALALRFGGSADAMMIGAATRVPSPMAAFANGELINALDFDAILAPGHVTPYVIPPALALAQEEAADGRQLILAVALAHEVGCRVANALDGLRQLRGRPPKLRLSPASGYGSTIFGAAAGAAKVLGFSAAETASLLGLAGYAAPVPSLTKYLRASHSVHSKYTSAGIVAMNATMSALMCASGYQGDETILDGSEGFRRMYASSQCDWSFMLDDLGSEWRMLRAEPKPYPAFRMSHPALEAVQEAIRNEAIDPSTISSITVHADPVSMSKCYLNKRIENHTDAQLSWPYLVATACYYESGPAWQTEAMSDSRVTDLMERVNIQSSEAWAQQLDELLISGEATERYPEWQQTQVDIKAGNKTISARTERKAKGHVSNPMTREELDRKFLHNATTVMTTDQAEEALGRFRDLESAGDISELMKTIAAPQ